MKDTNVLIFPSNAGKYLKTKALPLHREYDPDQASDRILPGQGGPMFAFTDIGAAAYVTKVRDILRTPRGRALTPSAIDKEAALAAEQVTYQSLGLGNGDVTLSNYSEVIVDSLNKDGLTAQANYFATNYGNRVTPAIASVNKFLQDPMTEATLMLLNGSTRNDKEQFALNYITLAHAESNFSSAAQSSTTSAKGQLQITKATYAESLRKFAANKYPVLAATISKVRRFLSAKGMTPQNRLSPSKDASQPFANFSIVCYDIEAMNRDWYYKDIWCPHKMTPMSTYVYNKYKSVLKDNRLGRQLLISLYHINGSGVLHLKKLSHEDRLMADPDYLSKLTVVPALPSYALSSAAKRINSSVQLIGDPISDENEAIAMAAGTTGSLRHPKVVVTSSFGRRKVKGGSVYHKGIDIRAPLNTYVYAPDDAVMQPHYHHKGLGWGKMAILKCKDGTLLRFAHLNRILIASGTAVRAGTIIAQTGMTGTSAPHLHFEYLPRGIGAVNPLNDPKKRYLKIL